MSIIQTLIGLVGIIPAILVLVAAIIVLVRTRHASAILMVVGQSINLLISLFYSIAWPIMLQADIAHSKIGIVSSITNVIGIIGSLTFGVGLLILALIYLKKRQI